MNGAECGKCGNIKCTCDPYPAKLGNLYHRLRELRYSDCPVYKQSLCMEGILMVFDRIEEKARLSDTEFVELQTFMAKLQCLINPPKKKWWQFWKRS